MNVFAGGSDFLFLKETGRVLDEKGRLGVIPFYLDEVYYVAVSPYFDQRNVKVESEAKKVWRDDEHRVPFSRHYSPEAFKKGYIPSCRII